MRRADAGQCGFTLVELLIALTLVGLLATLVFAGTKLAAAAWNKTDARAADAADLWAVENVLRQSISAAHPSLVAADPRDRMIAFDGGAEALTLLAPLPQAIAAGVVAQLRFFLVPEAGSRLLVMGWRLDLPAASGSPLPESRVRLLDRVRMIRFDYFGPADAGGAPLWQGHWSGRSRLPDLVRVHIERDSPSGRGWPDVMAEPRAAANFDCFDDAVAVSCRGSR